MRALQATKNNEKKRKRKNLPHHTFSNIYIIFKDVQYFADTQIFDPSLPVKLQCSSIFDKQFYWRHFTTLNGPVIYWHISCLRAIFRECICHKFAGYFYDNSFSVLNWWLGGLVAWWLLAGGLLGWLWIGAIVVEWMTLRLRIYIYKHAVLHTL